MLILIWALILNCSFYLGVQASTEVKNSIQFGSSSSTSPELTQHETENYLLIKLNDAAEDFKNQLSNPELSIYFAIPKQILKTGEYQISTLDQSLVVSDEIKTKCEDSVISEDEEIALPSSDKVYMVATSSSELSRAKVIKGSKLISEASDNLGTFSLEVSEPSSTNTVDIKASFDANALLSKFSYKYKKNDCTGTGTFKKSKKPISLSLSGNFKSNIIFTTFSSSDSGATATTEQIDNSTSVNGSGVNSNNSGSNTNLPISPNGNTNTGTVPNDSNPDKDPVKTDSDDDPFEDEPLKQGTTMCPLNNLKYGTTSTGQVGNSCKCSDDKFLAETEEVLQNFVDELEFYQWQYENDLIVDVNDILDSIVNISLLQNDINGALYMKGCSNTRTWELNHTINYLKTLLTQELQ